MNTEAIYRSLVDAMEYIGGVTMIEINDRHTPHTPVAVTEVHGAHVTAAHLDDIRYIMLAILDDHLDGYPRPPEWSVRMDRVMSDAITVTITMGRRQSVYLRTSDGFVILAADGDTH